MTPFGLLPDDLEILRKAFRTACGEGRALNVWIFGSRARGDDRPYSDIDLLVDGTLLSGSECSRVEELLEESRLPFKVDLVSSTRLDPAYREGVESDKRLLFSLP